MREFFLDPTLIYRIKNNTDKVKSDGAATVWSRSPAVYPLGTSRFSNILSAMLHNAMLCSANCCVWNLHGESNKYSSWSLGGSLATGGDQEPEMVTDRHLGNSVRAVLHRTGLIAAGAYLLHILSVVAYPPIIYHTPGAIALLVLCGVFGFVLIVAAGLQVRPAARWLILAAYLLGVFSLALKWMITTSYSDLVQVDTALYMDFAARLFLEGRNPYDWDYAGVFDLYRTSQIGGTPRLDGVMAISSYPYPALSFLLLVPFHLVGLPGAFTISYAALALLMLVVFINAPKSIQPLVLLPFVTGMDFSEVVPIGTMDIVWCLLFVCMIASWKQPLWRAALFGFAIASKQNAWLVGPFLLIRLWYDHEDETPSPWRRLAVFLGVSGGIFAAFNAPFLLWDPRAWLEGIAVNISAPLVMFSQGGLASLTQLGLVTLPKNYFMLVMLVALGLLLVAYWRHYSCLRHTLWFIPGIFLWMTYRNINSYWLYWIFPAVAALKTISDGPSPKLPKSRAWKPTLLVSVLVLIVVFAAGVWLAQTESGVAIEIRYPLYSANGRVNKAEIVVTNNTDHVLTPRFFVQHQDQHLSPLAWEINEGPLSLRPGDVAHYMISTRQSTYSFLFHEDAQLIVTDAGGNYDLRAVIRLEPDHSYFWPEAITNPDFRFWDTSTEVPSHWSLISEPPHVANVTPLVKNDRLGVRLSLNMTQTAQAWTVLQNLVEYQHEPFGIWLYYDSSLLNVSEVAYGLEINDSVHQLWILYGPKPYNGPVPVDTYVMQHTIPADTWVFREIDLDALYAEAGWPPAPFVRTVFRDVDSDFQLIWLRLMVTAQSDTPRTIDAVFGPLDQGYTLSPQFRMAHTMDDPADYYVRLGEAYVRERNYDRAQEAFEQALKFEPDNTSALIGIEQLNSWPDARHPHE